MNRVTLHKIDTGTTKVENKVRKTVRKIKRSRIGFYAIIFSLVLGISLSAWLITSFNAWSVKHEIIWQSPIVLRVPVYIREVKPVIKIQKVEVTPTPTPVPKSERQIIDGTKHAEVLWKVYGLESTWGKADGCRINGQGYAGFGVMDSGKVVCYPTFEKAVERAEYWLVKNGVDKDLATALCTWNTGVKQPNCQYYQSFLSL